MSIYVHIYIYYICIYILSLSLPLTVRICEYMHARQDLLVSHAPALRCLRKRGAVDFPIQISSSDKSVIKCL